MSGEVTPINLNKNKLFLFLFLYAFALFLGAAAMPACADDLKAADLKLLRLPLTRQSTDYSCGAAALQSVLFYYGEEITEDELIRRLKTNPQEGTAYRYMVKLATRSGFHPQAKTGMTLEELCKLIDAGKPVICLIQAWSDRKIADFKNHWSDGHYVVAIGHDDKNIYFMDPSMLGNYAFIPKGEFLDRWHDQEQKRKLVHFGMTLSGKACRYDSLAVKKLP